MTDNTPADIRISELSIENETLKNQVTELKKALDEKSEELQRAEDVISAGLKAKLSQNILASSRYTVEDLSKMSVDEMRNIEKVLSLSNVPYKGIRPGVGTEQAANLTVPDKFAFGSKKEGA